MFEFEYWRVPPRPPEVRAASNPDSPGAIPSTKSLLAHCLTCVGRPSVCGSTLGAECGLARRITNLLPSRNVLFLLRGFGDDGGHETIHGSCLRASRRYLGRRYSFAYRNSSHFRLPLSDSHRSISLRPGNDRADRPLLDFFARVVIFLHAAEADSFLCFRARGVGNPVSLSVRLLDYGPSHPGAVSAPHPTPRGRWCLAALRNSRGIISPAGQVMICTAKGLGGMYYQRDTLLFQKEKRMYAAPIRRVFCTCAVSRGRLGLQSLDGHVPAGAALGLLDHLRYPSPL